MASTVNTMPGTVSANSRKLRDTCGMVAISRCETICATSGVFTSVSVVAVTVMLPSEVALALAGAADAAGCRFRVTVEATFKVTVRSVPGPASIW